MEYKVLNKLKVANKKLAGELIDDHLSFSKLGRKEVSISKINFRNPSLIKQATKPVADIIKILILEDNQNDAILLDHELKSSGLIYSSVIVETRKTFEDALQNFKPDIILSDYALPAFNAIAAFEIVKSKSLDIPFIIVSGTIGEEKAVELIKNGFTDYALKNKLYTLPLKIERGIRDAKKRKEKALTDEKLYKVSNLYAFISQVNQNIVRLKDEEKLFNNSCNMAIQFGKFKIAWIGLFDFENKTISVVEQSGIREEDLPLFMNTHYQSKGPQDHVLQTGSYFICNDIQNDLELISWKPFCLERNLNSCIVLPIKKLGNIIATLNLYSDELYFSGAEEIELLVEVTGDISFALDIFENKRMQNKMDQIIFDKNKQIEFDKNNLNALINNTEDLMWSVDKDFNLITSNKSFDEMSKINFGRVIEKGHNALSVAFSPEMYNHFKRLYERAFAGDFFIQIDYFEPPFESWIEISYSPIYEGELIIGAACHSRNITERKIAEIKINESESKYRMLIEQASDAIMAADANGAIIETNTSCENLFGYSKVELLTMTLNDLLTHEDITANPPRFSQLGIGETVVYERKMKRKDNTVIDTEVSSRKIQDGKGIAIIRDISERKKSEALAVRSATQIRNFARNLNQVLEDERSNLAREIHDELGQQLSSVKMDLALLKGPETENTKVDEKINLIMKDVDYTIQSLRKIATELRPGILDSLGVIPSIQWLAEEFQKRTHIKCIVELDVQQEQFTKDISICFFRICQEGLTNISKHAKAKEVNIRITQSNNELNLELCDDGKGMSGEKLENPFSMGLLGMKERAKLIGAKLVIKSQKDKGTTLQLNVKLN